jgi:hypothetical protein
VFGSFEDCSAEIEEAFLESVLAFETAPRSTLFELLAKGGIDLTHPDKMTDGELTSKLWQVIRALLSKSVILCNTDHLSDRELYTLMWNETLREANVLPPCQVLHLDMTISGENEGMSTYLKYYATEGQRRLYAQLYPEFEMPEHVEPPRRRDHLIPDVRL